MKVIGRAPTESPRRSGDRNANSPPAGGGTAAVGTQPLVVRTVLAFAALASWGLVFVMVWRL